MTPRDDLNELLSTIVPFAQEILAEHGEFAPLGAVYDTDGMIRAAAIDTDRDYPDAEALIGEILVSMRAQAETGEIDAAAICSNVSIAQDEQELDAIRVTLEHREGEALSVFFTYEKLEGGYEFGEPQVLSGQRVVFEPPDIAA